MSAGRHSRGPSRSALRSLPALVLQAVLVLGLVAGTTAFVARDKHVTISVDGQSRTVRTFSGTVADLLESQDLSVDLEHDMVSPSPSQRLKDGESVVVRFGRPVLLTVDGETRTVWTTARSVSEALLMLGVRSDGAYLSASRTRRISRGGMSLDVRLPHHVTFLADGDRHEVTTTAPTLRSAMAEAGIELRTQDRVNSDLSEVPYAEQVVGVTRVDGKRVVEQRPIRFKTVEKKSSELYKGDTRILKAGKVGIEIRRFRETYLDGKLDSRRLVEKRIAKKPVTQVVLVGTKPMPQNAPTADGLNWAALADCESGGNPQAVNSAGPYYGLYQFSQSTWESVGGTGLPTENSASEQTYRAQILYNRSGAGQWPVCGKYLFT
jgi:resuscitation-promoting factor RpfB